MFRSPLSMVMAGVLAATLSACGASGSRATQVAAQDVTASEFQLRVVPPAHPLRAPQPYTDGNSAKLFVSPQENVPAVHDFIASAKKSIAIEVFNFINDHMGAPVADQLIAKAKAGVKVQVLVDFCGSRTRSGWSEMSGRLRAAGVEVLVYNPRLIVKDDHMAGVNITHRKLYLVDGTNALVGGVNLREPFDTTTQDLLLWWQGPIVPQLYDEFAHEWQAAGGKDVLTAAPAAAPGNIRARVAVTSCPEGRYEIRDTIYQQVDAAQREIRIEQQYLWDTELMKRLHNALARGVKVRAIVPGEEDKGVFKYIHSDAMKALEDAGGEARVYAGYGGQGHLHAKYFGVDDRFVAVGSCNGDTRGFMDNNELDAVVDDAGIASQVQQRLFEHDWAVDTKPFVYKPSSVVTRPFRSLLDIISYFM